MAQKTYTVAVVGATGAVGTTMLRVLQERKFPVKRLAPLASERSQGKSVRFRNKSWKVEVLSPEAFEGVDIALFSAGAARSLEFAPQAVKRGAVVIDNSSAFRMSPDVPLVVPEVNPHAAARHRGILAVPNCSTIVMLVALKPLHDAAGLKRIIVSTYQSVSGAGSKAMHQLWREGREVSGRFRSYDPKAAVSQIEKQVQAPLKEKPVLPQRIAFNLVPQIDVFMPDGYTKEELKMRQESRKILELPDLFVSATCVRVPVYLAHSEVVTAEFDRPISPDQARALLAKAPGVALIDEPAKGRYPMPIVQGGKDNVAVGRVRQDPDSLKILHLWTVGDNLRKGAATNAVQIAELLVQRGLFPKPAHA